MVSIIAKIQLWKSVRFTPKPSVVLCMNFLQFLRSLIFAIITNSSGMDLIFFARIQNNFLKCLTG